MFTNVRRLIAAIPQINNSSLNAGNLQQKAKIFVTSIKLNEPPIPTYERKQTETTEIKKARLLYQSRKRGMLENDLLLSTFAGKYLPQMNDQLLEEYDRLINEPSNDWEIYYWATGAKPIPEEFNNSIMRMLKDHVRNAMKEDRTRQPDLPVY